MYGKLLRIVLAAVLLIGGAAAAGAAVTAADPGKNQGVAAPTTWNVGAGEIGGGTVRSTLDRGDVSSAFDRLSGLRSSDGVSAIHDTVSALRDDDHLDSLSKHVVALV